MKKRLWIILPIVGILIIAAAAAVLLTQCGAQEPAEPDTAVQRTQGIDYDDILGDVTLYSVVVPTMATESELYAAETLVAYVEQITGKTLPYAPDGAYSDGYTISVGRTEFLETSGLEADADVLGTDGFILKTKGSALLICGGADRGTVYGVQDFLEYHLGVKFLTADCTYIPDAENAVVYGCDRTEVPSFEYRVYLDADAFYNESPEINVQHRFTSEYLKISESMGGNMKWYQDRPTHNALFWAQVENYLINGAIGQEYTHAFANDGSQIIIDEQVHGEYTEYAADLCYSDGINEDGSVTLTAENGTPTAIAMAIEGMKKVIRADTQENNYYMFGQNDTLSRPCLCHKCLEGSQKYTDTGVMIRFFNALAGAIAEFVEEEGIERQVSVIMFAYQYSAFAPVEQASDGSYVAVDPTCIPREDLVIRLAPINANRFVAYEHEAQDETLYGSTYMAKWESIAGNFMLWEYTTNHNRWYWFYPTTAAWYDKLETSRDMGVRYVLLQSTHQEYPIYQSVLERYVASKLLWNIDYDINELIAEFHRYYLGDIAAPYADAYVELMIGSCNAHLAENGYRQSEAMSYVSKGLLQSALALLDEAIAEVEASELSREEKEQYTERLELIKLQPRYMYLLNYMQYETDEVQMKLEVRQFIQDAMAFGGQWCVESKLFDLENLIFY